MVARGERMKLGLMIHDPEEEHDCFAEQHARIAFLRRARHPQRLFGSYRRADRSLVTRPERVGIRPRQSSKADDDVRASLDATMQAMNALYLRALNRRSYDQMIGEGNEEGNTVVQRVVDALLEQTRRSSARLRRWSLKPLSSKAAPTWTPRRRSRR